uniref:NADH dehydrogenase subunit 4l n=1 Tax=Hyalomma asiaticum TaxID=266040 RepID=A0A7T8ZTE8_HYAAI|nr:NADH dehydrogenase subunit 4L [Hyalomma asiaticum]QQQ89477.1 NADH dehydrogenase subunit 4l [Hyalomma asiaticum]
MMSLILMMYLIGMVIFFFNFAHLMLILLSIEFIYMVLLLLLVLYFSMLNILSVFIFLMSIVCEAGLGLSLLVMMSFYYGNEFTSSLNLVKC